MMVDVFRLHLADGNTQSLAMRQGNLFEDPSPPSVFPSRRVETAAGFVPLSEIMPPASAPRQVGIARLAAQAPEICQDPPGFDRAAFHSAFNLALITFFQRALAAR